MSGRPAGGVRYTVEPARAEPPLVLALDLGTSSVRAFIFDRLGRRLGGTRIGYDWRTTPEGGVEVDAEALLAWTAEALDGALERAGERVSDVVAVGVAAFWHSVLGVDEDGEPVTPIYGWNDMRATAAAERLRREFDEREVHARTGAVFHPSYLPARLLWLSEAQPERFGRARFWMSAAEYLGLRLSGERRASLSMASATGLFNERTRGWDEALLDALPLAPDQLSPLVDLDAPFDGLRGEFARRWPALADLPWLPAVGDGAAANVGSGCVRRDAAALSLGTSGALRLLSDEPSDVAPPRGLWRYRLDADRVLTGGAVSNGGNVYEAMCKMLHLPEPEELEQAIAALPPDTERLTVLPYFAGERSPDWPLEARGAILGLTLDTTPVELMRASLEAVAYRLALIHRRLHERFPEIRRIVASGGGVTSSPAWARIIADVLGQPIMVSPVREASSRGAALLALEAAGELPDLAAVPTPDGETIQPDPERHERYQAAIERYREFDDLLDGWTWTETEA